MHTFTSGVNLKTAGSQTVTVNDAVTTSIVGSQTVLVHPAVATHLDVTSIPNPATAGAAYDVVVAARDQFDNVATGYRGTIQFTSSDPAAILPANYTFSALDAGTNTFTDGVILKTPGSRWVKATDMAHASITGMQTVVVKPGVLHHFTVSAPQATTVAGVALTTSLTLTAYDVYNNIKTDYTGTVTITSTDPLATKPGPYAFTTGIAGDNGIHTFAGSLFTLKTAGDQTFTFAHSLVSVTTAAIEVNPAAVSYWRWRTEATVAAPISMKPSSKLAKN